MHRGRLNAYETVPGKSLLAQIPIAKSRHNAIRADNRQRQSCDWRKHTPIREGLILAGGLI
jgi:hypothetical protein